jgi:homoserine dehydrogenase
MKEVNLVLLGYGRVGRAFLELLHEKRGDCRERYGIDFRLAAVYRREGGVVPGTGFYPESKIGAGWGTAMEYPRLLREIMPGTVIQCIVSDPESGQPGLGMMQAALEAGWHIAAADKGPLVAGPGVLEEAARRKNLKLKISGASAAALPALDVAVRSLAGATILRIEGILNGTTNLILTSMGEGMDYTAALRDAQRRGIAESDPSRDVTGMDTAFKLLLICNAACGTELSFSDIEIQGIDGLPPDLAEQAKKSGKALKLFGRMTRAEGAIRLEVAPAAVGPEHPLFAVRGTEKGVTFTTDTMGDITVIGGRSSPRGAAAALLKDIIDIHKAD